MTTRFAPSIALAALLGLALSLTAFSQALPPVQDTPDGPYYLPGEVLIKFVADVSDQQLDEVVRLAGVTSARHLHTAAMKARGDNGITRAFTTRPVAQAIQTLRNHPAIEYAEPNWVYQHHATPNDPYFTGGELWGMYGNLSSPANAYGSQAAEAWTAGFTGSKDVVVGVIDEGIQITHPDVEANIWVNSGEIAGNGIDDDGNGYVDDVSGWDFYENNNTVYDGTGDDHGTHVTGTIGAVGGNGAGVVGVNWAVSIISGKFLGPDGGSTTDAIEAVDYFTALRSKGVNVVALNNSWGGSAYSQALHDAIIRAAKAGILFVASSGNGNRAGRAINIDSTPTYPACYNTAVGTSTETAAPFDAVISVTAIDSSGNKASFANYGATTVDLGAPGVSILSTLPTGIYGSYSGTSMAAPHVTGAIALYASTHPDATAEDIKTAILNSTAPTPSLAGKTVTGGRLDLSTVITEGMNLTAPEAPTGLEAEAINYSQIRLTWNDNSDNESRFQITRTLGTESTIFDVGANVTSYTDSGLTANTSYTYEIRAWNSVGCSEDPVATASATTLASVAATASFVKLDTATQGNWIGKYGTEGYDIVHYQNPPAYGTITVLDDYATSPTVWAASTSESRALSTPDQSSRFAACYFDLKREGYVGDGIFYFDVNLNNDRHRVSLYCLDWDPQNRIEKIEIIDAMTGASLGSSQTIDNFQDGIYLTWIISGHVLIKVTWIPNASTTDYDNAVVSGIFLDPVPDALPTVSITSPAAGATISGPVTITADASDDRGVEQVEFFVDSTSIGIGGVGTDGWSFGWDSTQFSDGIHALTAIATDSIGQATTSATVNVMVDNVDDPPTVSITSPADGATVSGTLTITADASDDGGVQKVEFFVEHGTTTVSIGVGTTTVLGKWSVLWNTESLDGPCTLTAIATDTIGQSTASKVVNVTVNNSLPGAMHCGDLDGIAASSGANWKATVTVTIHDASHTTVSGAKVSGTWSGGTTGTASGTTSAAGTVSFTSPSLTKKIGSVTFTITGVTGATLAYDSSANHDADGDSDGTRITVYKP